MNPLFIIGAVVVIFFLGSQAGLFSILGVEDWIIYDDFTVQESFNGCSHWVIGSSTNSGTKTYSCPGDVWSLVLQSGYDANANTKGSGWSYIPIDTLAYPDLGYGAQWTSGTLVLASKGKYGSTASLTSKIGFKNKDAKITGIATYNSDISDFEVLFGKTIIYDSKIDNLASTKNRINEGFVLEIYQSLTSNNLIVIVNGVEKTVPYVDDADDKIKFITNGRTSTYGGNVQGMTLGINEVKYRYFFNCEVETDEEAIRDVFNEGTSFNIHDLTYAPTKFCLDSYPAVLRSFEEGGVRADIRGEITKALARGDTITVPAGSTLSIHYIADFQTGMTERCALGEAYDTQSNVCVSVIDEAPDPLQPFVITQLVQEGIDSVYFEKNLVIGDLSLTSTKPSFSCASEVGENDAFAPNPRSDCWGASIGGVSFKIGETKAYNAFLDIKLVSITAQYDASENKVLTTNAADWTASYLLTIKNKDFFNIKPLTKAGQVVPLDSAVNVEFELTNTLASFTTAQSGYRYVKTTDLITSQEALLANVAVPKGSATKASQDVDTSQLGQVAYTIRPFLLFGNKEIYDDKQLVYSYIVGDKEIFNVTCVSNGCVSGSTCNTATGVCETTIVQTITETITDTITETQIQIVEKPVIVTQIVEKPVITIVNGTASGTITALPKTSKLTNTQWVLIIIVLLVIIYYVVFERGSKGFIK